MTADLPWHVLRSPAERWAVMPSFVIGELLFIALAALAFAHAWRSGRRHVLAWIAALVAGTANDVIFMALPVVDNFWQAQAMIMLTPRMPLYIPCVYVCFMYIPTVSVWRAGLPRLAGAALSGLAASVFYAPYDIVGAKFLWWTWHDSDAPIANRLLGAPIGSTMWVITFVAAYAWLLGGATRLRSLIFVAIGSTPIMVLQLTALQQLDGGVPGVRGLVVVVAIYAAAVAAGWRRRQPAAARAGRQLAAGVLVYFATLAAIMAIFDPATHRSESVHQTYGPCHVEAKDLMGHVRHQFVCAEDYDEDYTFCGTPPAEGSRWYAVCGRPHTSFPRWMGAVAGLGALGILGYGWLAAQRKS